MTLKYRFTITYQTPRLRQVNDFLKRCDLGIEELVFKEIIQFSYSKEEKPDSYFIELIKRAMEATSHTMIDVVGGKVDEVD